MRAELAKMLEEYRSGERHFPSYDDLIALLNAQPRVSCHPAENEAIARDAQSIVDVEVAALACAASQMPRVPKDCSGTPASCPDNEGYGCACSPAAAAPQVVADERAAFEAECEKLNVPTNSNIAWKLWQARAAFAAAAVQPVAVPDGDLLKRLTAHASVIVTNICGHAAAGNTMNGWLDDACTSAEILQAEICRLAAPAAQGDAKELTDDDIVQVLHLQGVDTHPSKYGFGVEQIEGMSVTVLRGVIAAIAAKTAS